MYGNENEANEKVRKVHMTIHKVMKINEDGERNVLEK
jgi:hypothetical protein